MRCVTEETGEKNTFHRCGTGVVAYLTDGCFFLRPGVARALHRNLDDVQLAARAPPQAAVLILA